ncbi:MAG: hypothetical protein P4L68_10820 [Methylovirgula sp.]|nr:hypothetical protein [Methylovirgula sp.]
MRDIFRAALPSDGDIIRKEPLRRVNFCRPLDNKDRSSGPGGKLIEAEERQRLRHKFKGFAIEPFEAVRRAP